jgi:hypothetical protein
MEPTTAIEQANKPGRKRDDLTLLEDRAFVARLLHEGITSIRDIQFRINKGRPEEQKVGINSIRNDIEWLKKNWRKSAAIDYNGFLNQTLDELDNLKRICFEEFHKSKSPKITTEGTVPDDQVDAYLKGEEPEARITKIKEERREGNPAWIDMATRIVIHKCKLLGVGAPSKVAITNAKGEDLGTKETILDALANMVKPEELST